MTAVVLDRVVKRYGDAVAVDHVTLSVADGELVALLGPSGCGKTTTLRMVAGFVEASEGSIRIGGREVTQLPPHQRNTGLVFQNYALFPHRKVAQNVSFGLEMRKVPKAEAAHRVERALRRVRLEDYAERLPKQLSGGQQQRVALARALVIEPDVLLLDEPLSNLDARLRLEMRTEIRELQRALGLTAIFVTHDQEEAFAIADRIAVMNRGRTEQVGSPTDIYERPATRFVAEFTGVANFLPGRVVSPGLFEMPDGTRLHFAGDAPGGDATLAIRPERLQPLPDGATTDGNALPGRMGEVTYLGAFTEAQVRLAAGQMLTLRQAGPADTAWQPGRPVVLTWAPAASLLLPAG